MVPLEPYVVQSAKVVIDAIFGAGLARDVDGEVAKTIRALNERQNGAKVIAVDVPSGLDGNTGAERGIALQADETVTFFRMKPAHVLYPRSRLVRAAAPCRYRHSRRCAGGHGPAASALGEESADEFAVLFPWRKADGHKYNHGHAVIVSGPAFQAGAARMAARGALRVGAGLVTVAAPPSSLPENAAHLTAVMLKPCSNARALTEILSDTRKNAVLIGPGGGVGKETAEMVLAALGAGAAVVLDADALTSFADTCDEAKQTQGSVGFGFTPSSRRDVHGTETLFAAIRAKPGRPVVLTPHDGEFKSCSPISQICPPRSSVRARRPNVPARRSSSRVLTP